MLTHVPTESVKPTTPPDWTAREKELHCPLCGYNLRGLTEPRCPECGFKFTWQELLDVEKDQQLYLFEYGTGRNIKAFWKTYWRTCRPRRFWREISPANEVRWVRLIVYWILTSSLLASFVLIPYLKPTRQVFNRATSVRSKLQPVKGWPDYFVTSEFPGGLVSAQEIENLYPLPWHLNFWQKVAEEPGGMYYSNTDRYIPISPNAARAVGWWMMFFTWPIFTMTTLMIFRISMRQAKIKMSHIARAVIYSCDFGLLITAVAIAGSFLDDQWYTGTKMMVFAAVCAAITSYRLTIAVRQYIRAHMPLATVLASQFIALLIALVVLVPLASIWGPR